MQFVKNGQNRPTNISFLFFFKFFLKKKKKRKEKKRKKEKKEEKKNEGGDVDKNMKELTLKELGVTPVSVSSRAGVSVSSSISPSFSAPSCPVDLTVGFEEVPP